MQPRHCAIRGRRKEPGSGRTLLVPSSLTNYPNFVEHAVPKEAFSLHTYRPIATDPLVVLVTAPFSQLVRGLRALERSTMYHGPVETSVLLPAKFT